MIVISGATPLHYLLLIGHEQIIPEMFGRVVVPAAVRWVVRNGERSIGAPRTGLKPGATDCAML